MLRPGAKDIWHTKKPPSSWNASDRLFCWASSPSRSVVGLAELGNPLVRVDKSGETYFEVVYRSHLLRSRPAITELRRIPILGEASFLKSGPAMTVQPLSEDKAEVLIRIIHSRNPDLHSVWDDVELHAFPDLEIPAAGLEGNKNLVSHFIRERDRRLVESKKRAALQAFGKLSCEACSFEFESVYGSRGREFCEIHHVRPLSELDSETRTTLEDLAIVCSNCHRMLHRDPWITVVELRALLKG